MNARLNVNVALNRPAYQKSTLTDYAGSYHAGRVVDGDHSTGLYEMSCAHSIEGGAATANRWWAVDIGVALHVQAVSLTNRGENGWGTISVYSVQLRNAKGIARNRQTLLNDLLKRTAVVLSMIAKKGECELSGARGVQCVLKHVMLN